METVKEFRKLLAEKHKSQDRYERLSSRRADLVQRISELDDDLSAIAQDIAIVTEKMAGQ